MRYESCTAVLVGAISVSITVTFSDEILLTEMKAANDTFVSQ